MHDRFKERILLSPPHMSGREIKYIEQAFKDNWIVPLGPNVNQFESDMVKYLGGNAYAVAMNSGTSAIHIALRLMNVQPGEEILCSSATFIATANPIMYEKAIPVFIDSEMSTWNLCPESLLKAIEAKKKTGKIPRILICADLFGMSARYKEISDICAQYKIELIEDSAESLGSLYNNKKCGMFGRFGILSFNGNKIITTSGGGMLITHSQDESKKALFLITQARDAAPYYLHSEVGYNYRMSNICAGIGIGQLEALDERIEARRKVFSNYKKFLASSPIKFFDEPEGFYSNRWLTTALIDKKAGSPANIIKKLEEHNVEARHIWKPLHTQPVFKNNEFFAVQAEPIAEKIFDEGVCLPSGSSLSEDTQKEICQIINSAF